MLDALKIILDEIKYNREVNFAQITNKYACFYIEAVIEILEKIRKEQKDEL
jgi:hypothetical protein